MPSYKDILLRMHEFYFLEARHQRLMMWETVKWFTPILTLLLGSLGKFIIDYRYKMDFSVAVVLFSLSVFGGILCIIALHLLKMFYDTNLQYISMFIKVENELEFDTEVRTKRNAFEKDEHITFEKYTKNRSEDLKAEDFVKKQLERK